MHLWKRGSFFMMTGFKLSFDVMTGNHYLSKLILLVDIAKLRKACYQHIISKVAPMDTSYNISDLFNKITYGSLRENAMKAGSIRHSIIQNMIKKVSLN